MRWLLLVALLTTGMAEARIPGDLNADGRVDARDLRLLEAGIRQGDLAVDLNGDGMLGKGDREALRQALGTGRAALPSDAGEGLVVALSEGSSRSELAALMERYKARYPGLEASVSPRRPMARLTFASKSQRAQAAQSLAQEPNVGKVEANLLRRLHATNDPLFPLQWNLDLINAPEAWQTNAGSPEIVVAIADTGIAYEDRQFFCAARDFAPGAFVQGYDAVENDDTPNDDHSHGTHVAGTVAQAANNGIGTAGVAYNVRLMPIRVCDGAFDPQANAIVASCESFNVTEGIYWAVDNGAHIINLSLGGVSASAIEFDALLYAERAGVVVVASSGNDGEARIDFPAAFPTVVSVGAVDRNGQVASYSNYGPGLDVVAPGGSDLNGDRLLAPNEGVLQETLNFRSRPPAAYCELEVRPFIGTSMASPHVAGVAAMILASGTTLTPAEVRQVLRATAADRGPAGWDSVHGFGLLDAAAAVNYVLPRGW